MSKLTPAEAREKHARNLVNAIPDARKGIEAVTVAPGIAAAAAQEKMKRNLIKSIDDGTWATNIAAVPLEEWQRLMIEKGLGNIPAGIAAAADKVEDFFSQLFPYQDNLKKDIERLPDLTLEDSIARMTTWVRGMAKFKKK